MSGWASRLTSDDRALDWLQDRGLTDETIREYRLGYDGDKDAITIPVYEDGEPVRYRKRGPDPACSSAVRGLARSMHDLAASAAAHGASEA